MPCAPTADPTTSTWKQQRHKEGERQVNLPKNWLLSVKAMVFKPVICCVDQFQKDTYLVFEFQRPFRVSSRLPSSGI